jgi:glycosyltransferase involved in cell wall biosynthesis
MKVLFIVPYPVGVAASQRYRVEQWLPVLERENINYKVASFWDVATWDILYKQGYTLQKVVGTIKGFAKRVALLSQLANYSFIFIHREATPVGWPWFEWAATKVFRKKLIFDFDDAIWLENTSLENKIAANYKNVGKVADICRWSYKIAAGNSYLQNYALNYNKETFLLPTIVNTTCHYNQLKNQQTNKVTIGWIGSHSTTPYLKLIEPVLQQLEQNYSFRFIVIADRKPEIDLKSLEFIPWEKGTEVENLLQMNIGIMPLPNTEWAKGKCAFKALQYMALGIPAVVTGVGANRVIVRDGIVGYTCTSQQQWYERLELLLQNAELRSYMGKAAREYVKENYSVTTYTQAFLKLLT